MRTTVTSTALLAGLARADGTVWTDFVERYRPVLAGYAQRLGLDVHEAEDLAQDVFTTFAQGYRQGRYDRERGRLRSWLFGIASNMVRDRRKRRERRQAVEAAEQPTGALEQVPDERTAALWDEAWRAARMQNCLDAVRSEVEPHTFAAFAQFVLEQRPAAQVAAQFAISENAVFCAKQRVLRRLRALLAEVGDDW
jgi:RNA polymerase sigma-70 factor (ECF subfamily)